MTGPITLGELLRRKMADYGYTLEELAGLLGMTPGRLHRVIEGHIPRLGDSIKYRICLELDIAPRVLEEVLDG